MPSYFSNLISWAFSYPENRIFQKFHKNVYTMLPLPTFNSHLPAGFSRVVFIHWQHFWGLVEQEFFGVGVLSHRSCHQTISIKVLHDDGATAWFYPHNALRLSGLKSR